MRDLPLGLVKNSFDQARSCLSDFLADETNLETIAEISAIVAQTFEADCKVLVAGNGGSMADAMHFAEELTGRFRKDRRALPAISLSDPTHLSCVGNDYGFEHIFERLVEAYVKHGDLVILLSTSGESRNLFLAAQAAHAHGAKVCGFLGRGGGTLLSQCDIYSLAPGATSDRIQEIHMLCLHIVVEAVEAMLSLT